MFVTEVALVSDTKQVSCAQVNRVAAALQKQAMRDFEPIWGVNATVDAFDRLEDVPLGYWPIIIRDDIEQPGAAGVHLDDHGQPLALVQYDDGWALTASHECLEMLADPWGNRLIAGNSLRDDQGRVEFLVEVADPPEAPEHGYTVNGILVSDFLTPNYWDAEAATGVRYDYRGRIPAPRQVLRGGYISWHHPVSDHWWQQQWFEGDEPQFFDLGVLGAHEGESLRSAVDAKSGSSTRLTGMVNGSPQLTAARRFRPQIAESTVARTEMWRSRIDHLKASGSGAMWS
jgi:hypothetical protein